MLRRYSTGPMNENTETPKKIEAIAHTVRQLYFFFRQNIEETQVAFVYNALLLLLGKR